MMKQGKTVTLTFSSCLTVWDKNRSHIYSCNFWSTRPTTFQAGSDHYFHTECPPVRTYVRLSVRPFVRTSVRPSQNFKIKRQSLPAGTVGWPSGSLMTPVLWICIFSWYLLFFSRMWFILLVLVQQNSTKLQKDKAFLLLSSLDSFSMFLGFP